MVRFGMPIVAAVGLSTLPVNGQWVVFNEDPSRLSAPAELGAADTQEKDYAWGDVDCDGDIDLVALSKVDFPVHATIDISAELAIKRAAGACHRSQQSFATNRIVRMILRRRQTRETFMRARPAAPRNLREKDLFEGVEV